MATVIGVALGAFLVILGTAPSALDRQADSPLLGHPAPDLPGPSVTPPAYTSLGAFRGRWVVVNFFATWCVPCRREQPELVRFVGRHRPSGDVQLVMAIYADKVADVQSFLATSGADWPVVADPDGRVALDYGVSGVPETYLVDPGGLLAAKIVGGVTADGLDRILEAAKSRQTTVSTGRL